MQSSFSKYAFWAVSILTVLTPIVLYAIKFGVGFWEKPEDWGSLGGYLSGIYSPILAAGTLLILWKQLRKQIEVDQEQRVLVEAKRNFDLAIEVLSRLKLMEAEIRDSFDSYSSLDSLSNEPIVKMYDIYVDWVRGYPIKIKESGGELPTSLPGQGRVCASVDLYLKCLDELQASSNHPAIELLYDQAKLIGLSYYYPQLFESVDKDGKHFKPSKIGSFSFH